MSIQSSKDLTTLDFESIKTNLKEYLKSQKIFQDYDFEGSNINVLLDVLAYNTNLNSFYLNMIASEMFLDSAQLRDSIVSHAKELNYLPRSFRSASATVDIEFEALNLTNSSLENTGGIVIPRGTTFTGTGEGRNFTFVTNENIAVNDTLEAGENNLQYIARDVDIYEGNYVSDTYVVNNSNPVRYLITNKTVDTNSVGVTVIEDNGENTYSYFRVDSLFELDSQSPVFFIQAAENDSYEIIFGDSIIGRPPKDRSVIIIEYRKSNGELPNGIRKFYINDDNISGVNVTGVITREIARGGSIPESTSSIKLNAPRAFTTQERAVTPSDYEVLLKKQFSEINAVSAYGGEEASPPQFGKVIIAVDLKTTDSLPPSRAREYTNYIRPRSPLSIDPVFVTPEYMYVDVHTRVKYNINQTSLSIKDIQSIVLSAIQDYNYVFLNGFNKTLYLSRLKAAIDNSQIAIVSNDTRLRVIREFRPLINRTENYTIDFDMPLRNDIATISNRRFNNEEPTITSTTFYHRGLPCTIEDNGSGVLRIMKKDVSLNQSIALEEIGNVDYEKGLLELTRFSPQLVQNEFIGMYAKTRFSDVASQRRTILGIRDRNIRVEAEQVRI